MSISFNIESKLSYLLVSCAGTYDGLSALDIYQQIFRTAADQSLSRILIDCRKVKGDISVLERYITSKYVAELCLKYITTIRFKISLVGEEPPVDPERFGETVARNRGVDVLVTTDLAEAYSWLGIESTSD
jgi:hypothetical protein